MSEAQLGDVSKYHDSGQQSSQGYRSAGSTHPGYRREQNEDAFWGDENRGVWIVADGLGGHEAGEIASKTVVEEVQRSAATDRHFEHALQRAHALLMGDETNAANMGSTAVVLAEEGAYYHIYWVGDSRAYLWSPSAQSGTLKQITNDHSYVQMLIDSGAIRPQEAASHPNRHVITRCIGGSSNPTLEVDRVSAPWRKGDRLLLCSDGLSSEVEESEICTILADNPDNRRATDLLIAAALDAGGKDNITVQVIDAPACPEDDLASSGDYPKALARPVGKGITKSTLAVTITGALAVLALSAMWLLDKLPI